MLGNGGVIDTTTSSGRVLFKLGRAAQTAADWSAKHPHIYLTVELNPLGFLVKGRARREKYEETRYLQKIVPWDVFEWNTFDATDNVLCFEIEMIYRKLKEVLYEPVTTMGRPDSDQKEDC